MKFTDILEYQEMKPLIDEIHGIIKGEEKHPCSVCGKPTEFIEINYEGYFCSEECLEELEKEMDVSCRQDKES